MLYVKYISIKRIKRKFYNENEICYFIVFRLIYITLWIFFTEVSLYKNLTTDNVFPCKLANEKGHSEQKTFWNNLKYII